MNEYIKISDVIKICRSLYSSYGTTAFFNTPVFEDLLRTVAVEFPEPPEKETDTEQLLAINKAEVADKIQDLYLDNYPNPSADLEKFFHEVLRIVVNAKPLEVSNNVCND